MNWLLFNIFFTCALVSSLTTEIKPCSEDNSQLVLFYNDSNELVNIKSFKCKECNPGSVIVYNEKRNKLQCSLCPSDYYSTGSFIKRYNGQYNEFNTLFQSVENFNSKCTITSLTNNTSNLTCLGWNTYKNSSIMTQNNIPTMNHLNLSNFIIKTSFTLTSNNYPYSEIKIIYHYVNQYANISDAIFNIYVNNNKEKSILLNNTKSSKETISISLNSGYNLYLFEYVSPLNHNITVFIDSIEINGAIDFINTCIPCEISSPQGSPYCGACSVTNYYNEITKSCVECPSGTSTRYPGSIGIESCIKAPNCHSSHFERVINPVCNAAINQYDNIRYEKLDKLNVCSDEEEILNTLKEEDNKKNLTLNCLICPIGTYKHYIDKSHYECSECVQNTYTDKENMEECLRCPKDTISSKIDYYFFPSGLYNQKVFKIEIANDQSYGELRVLYTLLDNRTQGYWDDKSIKISIDSSQIYSLISSPNDFIRLSPGKHTIEFISIPRNYLINYFSIKGANSGGGYKCEETISSHLSNIYNKCPDTSTYYNKENNSCMKCPLFTKVNEYRTNCEVNPYISVQDRHLYFNLNQFNHLIELIREMNPNLVNEKYYGPISDSSSNYAFYISNNRIGSINQNLIDYHSTKGFVYKTKLNSDDSILSLGNQIDSIKVVNSKENKGIVISYINGDLCEEDNTKKYKSKFYIKCDNNKKMLYTPKLIKHEKCTYYFEWKTTIGCPLCLYSNTKTLESKCTNGKKFYRYLPEKNTCIITDYDMKNQDTVNAEDITNILLNTNDDYDVIKIFNIEIDNQEIIKQAGDTVITKEIVKEKCISFSVNFMFITTAFVLYILIVILGIFYWCKYRSVNKNYQKVVEVEIPSVSKTETNIEIVHDSKNSSNQQENSKENP